MGFRTVVITKSSKLDLRIGYMVVRDAQETVQIFLKEISVLIIESTAVSITAALLCELIKQNIKVIFCDEKHNPHSELCAYYGSYDCNRRVKRQVAWSEETRMLAWTYIVRQKIYAQAKVLEHFGNPRSEILLSYIDELQLNDESNREGHAAKVYFNSLFGLEFTRESDCAINSALNYGYSILLSCFNREIVANGCNTQFGLFHDNVFNQFNLSCDIMEPFRPFVDCFVYDMNPEKFETEEKHKLLNFLNEECIVAGTHHTILNGIAVYTKSVISALDNDDVSLITFPTYEL